MAKNRVLIVDDMPANIKVLNDILRKEYAVSVATSGPRALEIAAGDAPPDLILLDVMMPGMDGYEVCRTLKKNPATADIPVLFITAMSDVEDEARGLAAGGVDYITKPISPPIVAARVSAHMQLKRHRDHLEDMVRARTEELVLTQDVTIQCLASLAETRDNETGGHIRRTQHYVRALALRLREKDRFSGSLTDRRVDLLMKSAPLHDIGKVGVPDAILLKPGRLTEEEFEAMKQHTVYGREAIERAERLLAGKTESSFLACAREIAYTHHEKWNGKGYPRGLRGEEIPLSGRLMAVADVYDVLVSRRVYKPPYPHSKAVTILKEERGEHFDPDVIDAFLEIADEFQRIAGDFIDSGETGASMELG